MKAQHKSLSISDNRTNSKISHTKYTRTKLTPLDFDNFIPWFCLQFQVPIIVDVKRMKHEDRIPHSMRRTSSAKSKSKELKIKLEYFDATESTKSILSSSTIVTTNIKNAIPITAYYNSKDQLVEIAFTNCPFEINRKIIQAINLCLPFHKSLYRLKIQRCLTQMVLYEISKLLPHSNITDVCLDDNYLPEGNYYLLLDKLNDIRNLSLRRCYINDEVCKRIVNKMHFGGPASNTLLTLDLASNCITDVGAECIAIMLRQNRTLVYLNISDNKISDTGAKYILNHLRIFPLTRDERIARNYRQLQYFTKKIVVYRKCEEEILDRLKDEEDKENQRSLRRYTVLKRQKRIEKSKIISGFEEPSIAEQAEKMSAEIVGEFKDMFDDHNIIRENGQVYEIGNLKLSYLNLAYNSLGYFSIRKIYDVLEYQSKLNKPAHCKGLLKIVLEGNNIPSFCTELKANESFLETAITENVPPEATKYIKSSKIAYHKNK